MRIEEWISRLKTHCPSFCGRVEGAASLAAIKPSAVTTPSAFIIPVTKNAEPNSMLGIHSQKVTEVFGIAVFVSNMRDSTGEAAQIEQEPILDEIYDALAGWQPSYAENPIDYVTGRIVGFDDMVSCWFDTYKTDYYKRKQVSL